MLLNSYIFIFAYLPILLVLYFLCNRFHMTAGKMVLVIGGLIFYVYADWQMLFFLLGSVMCNYMFAYLIWHTEWRKIFLAIPIVMNVGLLLFFKYANFVVTNLNLLLKTRYEFPKLLLPVGISFITFQQIAYLVTIYRECSSGPDGGVIGKPNLVDYLVYILYFPKLLMGPLAEPADFIAQLNAPTAKMINGDHIAQGLKIFSFGLLKKVVLADTFATAFVWGCENINTLTSMDCFLIMLSYTFKIYFDFSGYSDMAVGVSRMLNISLPMNFDSPYKALSIRDFWKRWHISLTKFFTKYLYIPLGGSRKGRAPTYLNMMIVFVISGIWHGAGWAFILWGLLHGILSVLDRIFEKVEDKINQPVRWLVTFWEVNILWLLFGLNSINNWIQILKKMFMFRSMCLSTELKNIFFIPEMGVLSDALHYIFHLDLYRIGWVWVAVFVIMALGICLLAENNYRRMTKILAGNMVFAAIALVWGILRLSTNTVFVYSGF